MHSRTRPRSTVVRQSRSCHDSRWVAIASQHPDAGDQFDLKARPISCSQAAARHPHPGRGQSLVARAELASVGPAGCDRHHGLTEPARITVGGDCLRIGALTRQCGRGLGSGPTLRPDAGSGDAVCGVSGEPQSRNDGRQHRLPIRRRNCRPERSRSAPRSRLPEGGPASPWRAAGLHRRLRDGLRSGEVVTAVEVPALAAGFRSACTKLVRGHGG